MDVERVDVDELTEEQRELLEQYQKARQVEAHVERVENAIQEEVRRQNRWIETQIWTTDYSEVAVLDVVTYMPVPGTVGKPDIKAYRYETEDEAPERGFYSDRSGMQTEVQRVHREEFVELVEEEGIEPPAFLSDADVWDGDLGADENTERDGPEDPDAREE